MQMSENPWCCWETVPSLPPIASLAILSGDNFHRALNWLTTAVTCILKGLQAGSRDDATEEEGFLAKPSETSNIWACLLSTLGRKQVGRLSTLSLFVQYLLSKRVPQKPSNMPPTSTRLISEPKFQIRNVSPTCQGAWNIWLAALSTIFLSTETNFVDGTGWRKTPPLISGHGISTANILSYSKSKPMFKGSHLRGTEWKIPRASSNFTWGLGGEG